VSWDSHFADPIELPSGRKLITLRDAALYITKLPKAEHDADEWQAAMEALLLVAERDGPTMFARIMTAATVQFQLLSPMSAFARTADSSWGSRHVRKVQPIEDIVQASEA
jgi:hypothetical protein